MHPARNFGLGLGIRSVTALSTGEFVGAGYANAFSANIDYYQAYMLKHVPAAPLR